MADMTALSYFHDYVTFTYDTFVPLTGPSRNSDVMLQVQPVLQMYFIIV